MMREDQILRLILVLGSLVLVTSGLAAHRLSWSKGVCLGLVWLGIFLIATLIVSIVTGA